MICFIQKLPDFHKQHANITITGMLKGAKIRGFLSMRNSASDLMSLGLSFSVCTFSKHDYIFLSPYTLYSLFATLLAFTYQRTVLFDKCYFDKLKTLLTERLTEVEEKSDEAKLTESRSLMTKEQEESGTIKTATYIAYVKAAGGWVLFLLCCAAAVFYLFLF